ncbi:MAG: polyphosphate polymerase domain-containing protein [Acidobacteriota bacterium]
MPDRTLRSRFEFKYVISEAMADRVRRVIRPFVRDDDFGLGPDGEGYSVCSLYCDTGDYRLLRQGLDGLKNRFKLRVRTYTDRPEDPVYFEVKRRMDGVVLKSRARVARADALRLFERQLWGARPHGNPDLDRFLTIAKNIGAVPIARVRYLRKAWASATGEPVRITIDSRIVHKPTRRYELWHGGDGWEPTYVGGQVLEIKFTQHFPRWVGDMVRSLELQRLPVAKYNLSMLQVLGMEWLSPVKWPARTRPQGRTSWT